MGRRCAREPAAEDHWRRGPRVGASKEDRYAKIQADNAKRKEALAAAGKAKEDRRLKGVQAVKDAKMRQRMKMLDEYQRVSEAAMKKKARAQCTPTRAIPCTKRSKEVG